MGCRMNLRDLPKDADVGALVQMTMKMTQAALLRVYEIVEIEKRPLTEDERRALDAMLALFGDAGEDVTKLKKRSAH